jgi:hypothetical protein
LPRMQTPCASGGFAFVHASSENSSWAPAEQTAAARLSKTRFLRATARCGCGSVGESNPSLATAKALVRVPFYDSKLPQPPQKPHTFQNQMRFPRTRWPPVHVNPRGRPHLGFALDWPGLACRRQIACRRECGGD